MPRIKYADDADRIRRNVIENENGCWIWTGRCNSDGYGLLWAANRDSYAHRVAYEAWTGPIPDGLTLDHLCHTNSDCSDGVKCQHRKCANPSHLEPVSHEENGQRQWSARKPACVNGHPFDEANTYARPNGGRDCRACIRQRVYRYTQRRRLRAAAIVSGRAA